MLESLPGLKRELQKIERSQKLNPQNKIQRYQKKMLQLLIRQKTTILENEQLQKQLRMAKVKFSEVEKNYKNITNKLRQKQKQGENLKSEVQRLLQHVQNLETQIKMAQIGRLNQQQKYAQLSQEYKVLQGIIQEFIKLKQQIEEGNHLNIKKKQTVSVITELKVRNYLIVRLNDMIKQLDDNKKRYQSQILQLSNELQKNTNSIKNKDQQLVKLQQKLNLSMSMENNLKQKINQSIQSNANLESKIQQLTKEIHLLKLKNKQFQENLYSIEIEKGQQSLQFDKLDKENKKLKKLLIQLQEKHKQIEQEKLDLQEKCEQLNKNYKNTKKQLEKFKDSLSQATDYQTGFKSKIDKLELTIKQYRQALQQKDLKIQNLQQNLKKINLDLEAAKTETLQAKFNADEMKKKYQVVSQARSLAEQKLVLEREQNAKSLSSMIKEKEFCYRQNYKLLQLLQVKDKTLQKIINGLRNNEDLQKQLSLQISGKQNNTRKMIQNVLSKDIKSNKDRVRAIDEHLEKYKM